MAVAATVASLAPAEAATTGTMSAQTVAASPAPGCEPKGLWGGFLSTGGSLGAGTYVYAVTANGTSAPACPAAAVFVPVNNGVVGLQWNPTPGVSAYTVYRGSSPANLAPLALTVVCSSKCVAIDSGSVVPSGSPPTLATPSRQPGEHTDTAIIQTVDYGGTPGDNSDDPTTDNPADATPPALKTDLLRFPAGLTADPLAPSATCPVSGAGSLLGSLALHGRNDPDEDSCPLASMIGTIQALNRTPSGVPLMQGDVYLGAPQAGEALRLLIALRPLCSFHNPVAVPNSASCNAAVGSNNERDTEFLTVKAGLVERSPGINGLDGQLFDISSGTEQPLQSSLAVRANTGTEVGRETIQLRRLTPTLFGYADQATAATADDKAFVTLPTCGVTEVADELTTYADASPASASASFASFAACPSPPTPPPTADTTPPDTKIQKLKVKGTTATVKFLGSDSEFVLAGSDDLSFMCKLDKGKFKPCTSPKKFKHLDSGRHKVTVEAIDQAGNVDPSPAKKRFRI
jgi:hypothetical protein